MSSYREHGSNACDAKYPFVSIGLGIAIPSALFRAWLADRTLVRTPCGLLAQAALDTSSHRSTLTRRNRERVLIEGQSQVRRVAHGARNARFIECSQAARALESQHETIALTIG